MRSRLSAIYYFLSPHRWACPTEDCGYKVYSVNENVVHLARNNHTKCRNQK